MHLLDDGILTKILVRLPAKSLLRFKCVCRQWRSLISDPAFAKAQLIMLVQESPNPSHGILLNYGLYGSLLAAVRMNRDRDSGWNARLLSEEEFVHAEFRSCRDMGSCHGLICLETGMNLLLYNPTTRESRQLPQPPDLRPVICHGLGYDALNDDYKFVLNNAIYSLKSDSWRLYTGKYSRLYYLNGCGKYSNGHLYWLDTDGRANTIISFNTAAEEFYEHVLPIPKDPSGEFIRLCVSELGWLFVLQLRASNSSEVWVMKDCHGLNSTWTILCSFSREEISGRRILGSMFFNMAPLMRDGKIVFLCPRAGGADDAGIYDPEEDSLKTVVLPQVPGPQLISSTFVESLVPLHTGN